MSDLKVIDLLNVVAFDVTSSSGSVSKSSSSDDEAFTPGRVRFMDKTPLQHYSRIRQAATRLCRANGCRFLSGYAIPDDNLDEVRKGLAALSMEVARERATLMANLPAIRLEWETKHPEILDYRERFPTDLEVVASIGMTLSMYKVSPVQLNDPNVRDGIALELAGMPAQVLAEIAQDVKDSWSADTQTATGKAVGILQRVHRKLVSLSFVSAELGEIADMVQKTIDVLPKNGRIAGRDFIQLAGLMNTLLDPTRVLETARMAAAQTPQDLWGSFVQSVPAPAQLELATADTEVQVPAPIAEAEPEAPTDAQAMTDAELLAALGFSEEETQPMNPQLAAELEEFVVHHNGPADDAFLEDPLPTVANTVVGASIPSPNPTVTTWDW